MKPLLFAVLCTFCLTANSTDYYLSPAGNDNNPGTISSPFFSLNKAWTVVVPGDLVYLRGGTYAFKTQQHLTGKNGTAGNMITVQAYPNELPVLTKGTGYTYPKDERGGCYFSGNYVHFKGIRITGFTQENTFIWNGLLVENSSNCIFERLEVDNCGGGMNIRSNSSNNLIKNSDFHDNIDPVSGNNPGGNADGLDIAAGNGTNNVVTGCRAWNNSDDGFDCWEMLGSITFDNCWAWHNGYIPGTNTAIGNGVGFKLGSSGAVTALVRTATRCLAFNNLESGFHQNEAVCRMELYNNTSYNNGVWGYLFDYQNKAHIFKNNIAFNNIGANVRTSASTALANNSYGGAGFAEAGWTNNVTAADFVSLDDKQVLAARQADGSLPVITFLHLAAASDLINTGIDVGIAFGGTAPDRGAFETGGAAPPPPANQAPVANAGTDKNVTLPTSSVSITGTGTDADGTIASYNWTKQSGGAATLTGAATATLNVSGLVAGTYVFRLTVTDNGGATGFDEVTVAVSVTTPPPPPPSGANLINVSGAVLDAGFSYYVSQDFGTLPDIGSNPTRSVLRIFENGVELLPPHSSHSDIASMGRGRFSHWNDGSFVALYFSASDNSNPKTNGRTYTYSITSSATANLTPVANAGADKNTTLPTNSVSITGSASDPDGTIASHAWSLRSGPNTPLLSGSNTAVLSASSMIAGTYVFRLTVTDNKGLTAFDEVNIAVKAATAPSPATSQINVSKAVADAGFSYYVVQNFGTAADIASNPARSVLRIFENGVELLPPHSLHSDIQNIGRGRFSHWKEGTFVALYFSASDNSNPKTNGRTYTYSITPK
jgi:hypothetical protein